MILSTARLKQCWLMLLFVTALLAFNLMGAERAEAVDLRWDPGFQDGSTGPQTFVNIGGSGIDVRLSFTFQAGGFSFTTPRSDNFVVPSGLSPDSQESLAIGLDGTGNLITDIEFFVTGTTTRAPVLNPTLFLHDVDFSPGGLWRDVIEVAGYTGGRTGPGLGGTPVTGINVTPSTFNALVSTVAGVVTVQGITDDANKDIADTDGNVTTRFTQPVDTISFIFRNPPILTAAHVIGLGAVSFNAPTLTTIGASKNTVLPIAIAPAGAFGASTVRATYDIVVRNLGPDALNTVQVTENLDTVFGTGNYQVNSLTPTGGAAIGGAPTLVANGGFNGSGNQNLLAAGGTLAVGADATFRLVIDINSTSGTLPAQPFLNQVTATAVGAVSAANTTDPSNAGAIDPDGDGNPNEALENNRTALSFTLTPDLRLVKRITAVIRGGAPVAIPGINAFNDQATDPNDNQLQALSGNTLPVGVFNTGATLQLGDEIEYTIYFWNNGLATANNVELCDEIQSPTVLDNASLLLAPASGFPALAAFGPSASLSARVGGSPLATACLSAPGNFPAGGGVVVGGAGFSLAAQEVGAFRFRASIIP